MYLGVTHESASVKNRSYFAFDKIQRAYFTDLLKEKLDIVSISIISTCNRMEIYYESSSEPPSQVRDFLISYGEKIHGVRLEKNIFQLLDRTVSTIDHLLHVANGLRSAVVGDRQIISQIKESYQEALGSKNQGSLLERAFQAVFRSHKRIFKESSFLQGSTSTAYSSLKLIASYMGREELDKLNVLIIGAGEIAQDVLKYLPKFSFKQVSISNRTADRSSALAERHNIQTYDWHHVEANDFSTFDVIITGVSNRNNLIHSVKNNSRKRLWVDLAIPSNISDEVENHTNKIFNIDEITSSVKTTTELQFQSIPKVKKILQEELQIYMDWLQKGELRGILKSYKCRCKTAFLDLVQETSQHPPANSELDIYAENIANKMTREFAKKLDRSIKSRPASDEQNVSTSTFQTENKMLLEMGTTLNETNGLSC